ncbi:MAG: hypothetical protein HOJ74_10715 [Gemmatimonadales bacterium]|nr:hypothetical protein [Gemmatimonadales bacterium]MBT7691010.1 hypothetical protein [Gemmatimonadales bacterium]
MELVIVFFGVALALGAENYREHRVEVKATEGAMTALLEDLRTDSLTFARQAPYAREKTQTIAWLVDNRDLESPPADSIHLQLYAFNSQVTAFLRASAYPTLAGANRVRLIKPDSVRQALSAYYESGQSRAQYWIDYIQSFAIEAGLKLGRHVRLPGGQVPGELWPPLEERVYLVSSWRGFQEDYDLQNVIIQAGRGFDYWSALSAEMEVEVGGLIRMIEEAYPPDG